MSVFLSSIGSALKSTSTGLKPKFSLLLIVCRCKANCLSRTLFPLGLMGSGWLSVSPPSVGLTSPVSVFRQYFTISVFYQDNNYTSNKAAEASLLNCNKMKELSLESVLSYLKRSRNKKIF